MSDPGPEFNVGDIVRVKNTADGYGGIINNELKVMEIQGRPPNIHYRCNLVFNNNIEYPVYGPAIPQEDLVIVRRAGQPGGGRLKSITKRRRINKKYSKKKRYKKKRSKKKR